LRQAEQSSLPILNDMLGFKKTLLCVGGLTLAAGGPVTVYTTSDVVNGAKAAWNSTSAATASQHPGAAPSSTASAVPANPSAPSSSAVAIPASNPILDAMPMPSLAEVFRFDVTVEWVMRRWPRVSTGLPHLQLQGYRVPLVTGGGLADVAGSLTYYFSAQQQVQRIAFRGTTGDPGVLVSLLTTRYQFARRLTNDPSVVFYEAVDSSNRPVGTLKIRSASVIQANQPYSRFEVELAMDRS
jgi:hypothetical protein